MLSMEMSRQHTPSSPAGRLHGFLSMKSRLAPTQRDGILQVPDTPVLVLQLVPSTVNAELVWPDEESEDEDEDEEEDDDDDELLEDPELESFLSLGQPAEQWPHSPVPVTWLPPSSTRVLHQNLPSGSRSVIQLDLRVPPNRKGKTQGLP